MLACSFLCGWITIRQIVLDYNFIVCHAEKKLPVTLNFIGNVTGNLVTGSGNVRTVTPSSIDRAPYDTSFLNLESLLN
jgi:hypothetical protein